MTNFYNAPKQPLYTDNTRNTQGFLKVRITWTARELSDCCAHRATRISRSGGFSRLATWCIQTCIAR